MKQYNKRLYEKIMKSASQEVKRSLNEFNYWNEYPSRTWAVGGTGDPEKFFDNTLKVYDKWCDHKGEETVNDLLKRGVINYDMDFYDVLEKVEEVFNVLLDNAVGGDWWELGKKLGYDDDDLDRLYTDVMQAKVDCISGFDNY